MNSQEKTSSLYHSVTIGNMTFDGNLFLAPLAGYTDRAFRSVCIENGASFTYTEMVSAEGLARESANTEKLLIRARNEEFLGVQIFMNDSSVSMRSLEKLLKYNPSIIDINCGCPVPKVVKTGAGSALMNKPEKIRKMVEELKEHTDIPISIKIRKGWNETSVNFREVAAAAVGAGVDMITMHARTRSMYYSGSADWDSLKELKDYTRKTAPSVIIFGSGDLFTPQSAKDMLEQTGIDGVMFARGAIGNPFIFERTKALLTGKPQEEPPLETRLQEMLRQLHLMGTYSGEQLACREMRKHAASYLKGLPHGARAKQSLVQATTFHEYERVCDSLLNGTLIPLN